MGERRVSATEARVHFGELLDSVAKRNDVVFVERSGVAQVVVVSVEEWNRRCSGPSDPWAEVAESIEEHWAYLTDRYGDRVGTEESEAVLAAAREDRDARPL